MMKCEEVQKLENLGIAIVVDAFTSSKKIQKNMNKNMGYLHLIFYETYKNGKVDKIISIDDIEEWYFNCKCFILSGEKLN